MVDCFVSRQMKSNGDSTFFPQHYKYSDSYASIKRYYRDHSDERLQVLFRFCGANFIVSKRGVGVCPPPPSLRHLVFGGFIGY